MADLERGHPVKSFYSIHYLSRYVESFQRVEHVLRSILSNAGCQSRKPRTRTTARVPAQPHRASFSHKAVHLRLICLFYTQTVYPPGRKQLLPQYHVSMQLACCGERMKSVSNFRDGHGCHFRLPFLYRDAM